MKTLLRKKCLNCTREFVTFNQRKIYCASGCRTDMMKIKSQCKYCGQGFQKSTGKQMFCNVKCRNNFNNEKSFRVPLYLTDEQRTEVKELLDSFKELAD